MTRIIWLLETAVLSIHEEQIAEHGGGSGIRDRGLLESALARPEQLAHYGKPTLHELAAAYAYGLAKNHPFVDGNKRTAFTVAETFLVLNGLNLDKTDDDCVLTMLSLAAGDITEADFAAWLSG